MWWVIARRRPDARPAASGWRPLLTWLHFWLRKHYLHNLIRIFLEKPLFIIPRGQPTADAEEVTLTSADGIKLRGCYLKHDGRRRRGVILFGLEFGSNRWACGPYVDYLRAAGYDVFTWEPRNQGDSDRNPASSRSSGSPTAKSPTAGRRWSTSSGGPTPTRAASACTGSARGPTPAWSSPPRDPYVRCAVTDGAFAHYTTMVPYMRVWFAIYDRQYPLHGLIGAWYYGLIAPGRREARSAGSAASTYPDVERLIGQLVAAAAVDDPRRGGHLHQADDGAGPVPPRRPAEGAVDRRGGEAQPGDAGGRRGVPAAGD